MSGKNKRQQSKRKRDMAPVPRRPNCIGKRPNGKACLNEAPKNHLYCWHHRHQASKKELL